jgi:hypothetical protein
MKFLCDDGKVYYCKYRSGYSLNAGEVDFLAYEVVCHHLLRLLEVPTPNIALVELSKDSFSPNDLKINRKYAKAGIVCFGSQEVKGSNLVTGLELVKGRIELRQYLNPEDLVKIATFDLWIANIDRGRAENFNLLSHIYLNKIRIIAFDNAFAFHGQNGLSAFNSTWPDNINSRNNLSRTEYFKSITKFIPQNQRHQIAENVLNCNAENAKQAVNEAFAEIPSSWQLSPGLKDRILSFLLDGKRIATLKSELMLLLTKPKK